jgi:hypothetical protein
MWFVCIVVGRVGLVVCRCYFKSCSVAYLVWFFFFINIIDSSSAWFVLKKY